jgi:hypothetical protein
MSVSIAAGSSRRARRAQNAGRSIRPVSCRSRNSSVVIRKPDSVKNSDTPRNPPIATGHPAWKAITPATATPRRPSRAGSCFTELSR